MPLTTPERATVERAVTRWLSNKMQVQNWSKPTMAAAVAAIDDWADANAASFNAALPAEFRTNASAEQKALLLACVLLRRVAPGLLTRAFGVEEN